MIRIKNRIDNGKQAVYAVFAALIGGNGFGHLCKLGAEDMRRKAHVFFYAPIFLAGGVLGGRNACRVLASVDQPGTSSAAQSLVTLRGGNNPLVRNYSMNTQSQTTPNPSLDFTAALDWQQMEAIKANDTRQTSLITLAVLTKSGPQLLEGFAQADEELGATIETIESHLQYLTAYVGLAKTALSRLVLVAGALAGGVA